MGEPPLELHPPSRKLELVIVQSTLVGLAFFIVGLRLITRYLIVKRPGWDDHAIVFATVHSFYLVLHSVEVAETSAGYGNRRGGRNSICR